MKNPWTKKNPFLSMWLSGANSIAGSARGRAAAEAKRQTSKAMNDSARQIANFWTGGWMAPPPKKRVRRKTK